MLFARCGVVRRPGNEHGGIERTRRHCFLVFPGDVLMTCYRAGTACTVDAGGIPAVLQLLRLHGDIANVAEHACR